MRPALSPVPLRPTPAPSRQAVAPAPTPAAAAPPEEEEAASWDKLVSDTEDPSAALDTAPKSAASKAAKKASVSRVGMSSARLSEAPESSRRLWVIIAVVAVVAVLLIAGGVWVALTLSSGPRDNGTVGKEPLRVDPNGGGKMFRTIQDAVNKASPNDHIVLMADIVEPAVHISRKENLVIESAPGRKAVWTYADKATDRMLLVESASGFEMKDVVLDGARKADSLITLFGSCPGLKLSGLELKNFKQYGVNATSCDGTEVRPIVLANLHFTTTDPAQAGLYFAFTNSSLIQKTQYFKLQDFAFDGPGHTVAAANPDAVKLMDGHKVEQFSPKP